MSDGATVKLEGISQAVQALKDLERKAQRRIVAFGVRKGNRPLLQAAKSEAPHDTGDLARQLRQSLRYFRSTGVVQGNIKPKRTKAQAKKGASARASVLHLVVMGTRPHVIPGPSKLPGGQVRRNIHHPGSRANDFMTRAARRAYSVAVSTFSKAFGSRLEQEARKGATK